MTRPTIVREFHNEVLVTNGSDQFRMFSVHSPRDCKGHPCVIDNPTEHAMSDWPLEWGGLGVFYRVCPEHGTLHPDPDQFDYWRGVGIDDLIVHDCCGCCGADITKYGGPRVRCLRCNEVIFSASRHDFVTCSCGAVSVDGGSAYFRLLANEGDYEAAT